MNKIKRSSKLLKAAFAVLLREKKLFLFPIIASTLVLVLALFFLLPVVLYPTGYSPFTAEHWSALGHKAELWINSATAQQSSKANHSEIIAGAGGTVPLLAGHPWTTAVCALMYFISMFLATFSNVAFYHEIMRALNGDTVSIRRGYQFACERWRAVLLWSLFAGLVGYLIQTIQERFGLLGRLITGLIGFVWSTACIFVIPTIVRDKESANPVKLLRNSVGTLRNTWGELVIGFVGLELAFGFIFMTLLLLAIVGAGVGGFYLGIHFNVSAFILVMAGVGAMMMIIIPLSWISSIVNPVYRCALYIYATEGVVPGTFDKELLDSAWKVK